MVLSLGECGRRLLLAVLAVALVAGMLWLSVGPAGAFNRELCMDLANRSRAAMLAGHYDQANAARELMSYSKC